MLSLGSLVTLFVSCMLSDEVKTVESRKTVIAVAATADGQVVSFEHPATFVHRKKADPDDRFLPSESFDLFDSDRKRIGMKIFIEPSTDDSADAETQVKNAASTFQAGKDLRPLEIQDLDVPEGTAKYCSIEDELLKGKSDLPAGQFKWVTVGVLKKGSVQCSFRIYSNSVTDSPFTEALGIVKSARIQKVDPTEFMTSFNDYIDKTYTDAIRKAQALAQDRRLLEGNDVLLKTVPDEKKTAHDYFFLGNMLFEMMPKQAMELHEEALRLKPADPYVLLEVAMSRHQNGRYEDAISPYETFAASTVAQQAGPGVHSAGLAECLIRCGRYGDAVAAWNSVPFGSFKMKIAKSCFEMHGADAVGYRHAKALAAARSGDINAAADTIVLDCVWDHDWWNTEVNREYLEADLREFAPLFPVDDPTMKLLVALAEHHKAEEPDASQFVDEIKNSNLILGDAPVLPPHGTAVSLAVRIALKDRSVKASTILEGNKEQFQKALEKCSTKEFRDLLVVWCVLLRADGQIEKADDIDRSVWKQTNDLRFAEDLAATRFKSGKFDDDDFKEFLKQFPSHRLSVTYELMECEKQKKSPSVELLGRAICAEFEHLTPNRISGLPSADGLQALFRQLEAELK